MSLVGSLEDLGLADILQIVSLSRKSGMLVLRSEAGQGRILLLDGLVRGAAIQGEGDGLRGLLVGAGLVGGEAFERARRISEGGGLSLEEALDRECGLEPDRLARLRREHVESCVLRMFGWRSGEFSFEVCDEPPAADAELLLPAGLNTQYLAMEATRLGDEHDHAGGSPEREVEMPVFSGESGAEPADEPLEAPAEAAGSVREPAVAAPAPAVSVEASEPEPARPAPRHLIAIDTNLSSLEWLKATVEDLFERVHIFQRQEIAIQRIRQYLLRGAPPLVLMADPPRDAADEHERFLARLRALAPSMRILTLRSQSAAPDAPVSTDGVLVRPASPSADPDRWHLYRSLAERLRADLQQRLGGVHDAAQRRARGALERLKGVSDQLRDPSTQGEVLRVALEFGAESFGRVAMFMLRDGEAQGMAQRGLSSAGGPDDAGVQEIVLGPEAMPELFREVMEQRAAQRSEFKNPLERELARRLGDAPPAEAYAAPVESGGCVVAIVYADQLPAREAIPDTTAFEIVLHEAGLALDRAVLERALAERD